MTEILDVHHLEDFGACSIKALLGRPYGVLLSLLGDFEV
jgi:hypothetical protein